MGVGRSPVGSLVLRRVTGPTVELERVFHRHPDETSRLSPYHPSVGEGGRGRSGSTSKEPKRHGTERRESQTCIEWDRLSETEY